MFTTSIDEGGRFDPCSENLAMQPYNNVAARGGQNLLCRQNLAMQPYNNVAARGGQNLLCRQNIALQPYDNVARGQNLLCRQNLALQPYNNVAPGGQNLLCRQNLALQPYNNAVPYGEFGKENAVAEETKEAVEKARREEEAMKEKEEEQRRRQQAMTEKEEEQRRQAMTEKEEEQRRQAMKAKEEELRRQAMKEKEEELRRQAMDDTGPDTPAKRHREMFEKEKAFGPQPPPPGADPYHSVTTFQDLINLNVRYLQGENIYTPYHDNLVDEETLPLLADLIRVNKAGFHSTEGQPAMKERVLSNKAMWTRDPVSLPRYYDSYQKSYIVGIIPQKMVGPLANFLKNQPSVYFEMYQIDPFRQVADTFPRARYNLTKFRSSKNISDLEREPWKRYTNRRPRTNSKQLPYFEKYPRIHSLLKRECFEVIIACKEYGTGSVVDILLQFFNMRQQAPIRPSLSINRPRARSSSVTYVQECDIDPLILDFFQSMFDIDSPTLTPCQTVGRALLHKCVSPDEIKYYTFDKVLGFGLNGFVFQWVYKGVERRAVKMVIIDDGFIESPVEVTPSIFLDPVSKHQIEREFEMHSQLARLVTPSSGFNVLKIFGDLAVFWPPYASFRIGVYIMQSLLSVPTLHDEFISAVEEEDTAEMPAQLRAMIGKAEAMPRVITALHALGYAHSDLHWGNIAFDPKDPERPIVFDFGRTINVNATFSDPDEAAEFLFFDYMVPLYHFAVDVELAISMHNAYLRGIPGLGDVEWGALREIFSPITSENAGRHRHLIFEVMRTKVFRNETATFFNIVEPNQSSTRPLIPSTTSTTYIKECDIHPDQLVDFEFMFNVNVPALNACQAIGRELVAHCVPLEEIEHYTFDKTLGLGSYGFIFQCMYKGREPRAVKLVFVSEVPDAWAYGISPVTEKQVRHEVDMHRKLAQKVTPSSGFNVLKVFGDLAVFAPPLAPGFKIGVYIMESLPFPTLRKVLLRTSPPSLTPEVLANIAAIPRVINNFHMHGYAHCDLHSDNIAFDPNGAERPIVLDFGRTVEIVSTFKTLEAASTFCLLDYAASLSKLVGPEPFAIVCFNSMAKSMDVKGLLALVSPDVKELFCAVFGPLTSANAGERKTQFERLLMTKMLYNGTRDLDSFNDIVDSEHAF